MYGFADNMCITLSFVILDSPFHVGRPLHLFAAVKNLYLSEEYVPRIVPALQELVWGPNHRKHRKFISARQLTSRPLKYTLQDDVRLLRWWVFSPLLSALFLLRTIPS